VPLEDVIESHVDRLFPGMEVLDTSRFRVTRDADFSISDESDDLLGAVEAQLRRRRFGHVVRLEVEADAPEGLVADLMEALEVSSRDTFRISPPLDFTSLWMLAGLDRPALRDAPWEPRTRSRLRPEEGERTDLFAAIRGGDILVHHPYDDFHTSVERFVEQAVEDPNVLAIKQTVYRTSGDSPIVPALMRAAEQGKQTVCLVEVQARFDEERNIQWARALERAGAHVVYGLSGLKTHAKLCLVVRREGDRVRRYVHIGTGNYNPTTARLYEDMGLLTSNPVVTEDVAKLFNHLSGMAQETRYRRLLVAPHSTRKGIIDAIDREIAHHQAGLPAGVRIKVNSIVDEATTDAMYRASRAGVPVDLWVRGICSVKPGVPGLSENIRVRSILGRFLEHSRLFWFANNGSPLVGIGSSDLMHRNLDRRVEVLVALTHPRHVEQVERLFDLAFDPGTASWWLEGDTWTQHTLDADGHPLLDLQEHLIATMGQRRSERSEATR
jgi:polyphosphate kinase